MGGFCRVLYKPSGPSRIRSALQVCLNVLRIRQTQGSNNDEVEPEPSTSDDITLDTSKPVEWEGWHVAPTEFRRHRSEEGPHKGESNTSVPSNKDSAKRRPSVNRLPSTIEIDENRSSVLDPELDESDNYSPTIPIGPGGSLLKTSVGTINSQGLHYKVLVVEDNSILRSLLCVPSF